jgi:hypothetical protein
MFNRNISTNIYSYEFRNGLLVGLGSLTLGSIYLFFLCLFLCFVLFLKRWNYYSCSRKFTFFMGEKVSFVIFTKPLNWFLPGKPNSPRCSVFNIHFNIILLEKLRSCEISYSFNFPDQHCALIYYASNPYTIHQSNSLLFDSSKISCRRRILKLYIIEFSFERILLSNFKVVTSDSL